MVGFRLMLIMAVVGGLIAYIADKMGSKIGKKKMTVLGLRPRHTSILLTVIGGMLISLLSIGVVSISSESARTALFGMEKLQKELKDLNKEKEAASIVLSEAKKNISQQNEKISALNREIKATTEAKQNMEAELSSVNEKYNEAQKNVKDLSDAKLKLTTEVEDLEKTTARLRQGIVNMREGAVFYRAGEIVTAVVLRGGLTEEQNVEQMNWLFRTANDAAMQRLGQLRPEKPLQVIWISKEIAEEVLHTLNKSQKDYLCRVRTIANIIVGELVVCDIEMVENKLIYTDDKQVYSERYAGNMQGAADAIIMDFLTKVNHTAVADGVLADPITGKVGNVDAQTMVRASNLIKECTVPFTLTATTKGNVYTAGPLNIDLKVKPEKEMGAK